MEYTGSLEYTLVVHRPPGTYSPTEGSTVIFHSSNPIPIPRVGEEINREIMFNEHTGSSKVFLAIVTEVSHSIIAQQTTTQTRPMVSVVTVRTKEVNSRTGEDVPVED